ncbi:MAG: hypothetical protein AAF701_00040 [Pseudomonadota bacterium]
MDNTTPSFEPELDGYDIMAVFRAIRRRGLVLFAIISAVVGLTFYMVETQTPVFQSQALVTLAQPRTALENERDPLQNSAQIEALISTELRYLTSDNFLLDFIRKENLAQLPEYGGDLNYRPARRQAVRPDIVEGNVLPILRSKLSIQQEGASYIVSLTLQSEAAERAAHLANSAASLFVENASQRGARTTRGLADRVAGQLKKQSDELSFAIANLDAMIEPILQTRLADLPAGAVAQYQSLVAQGRALRQVEEEALAALQKTNRETANARLNLLSNVERRRLNILDQKQDIWDQVVALPVNAAIRQNYAQVSEVLQSLTIPHATYKRLLERLIDLELEADLFVSGASLLAPALVPQEPSFPKKKNSLILSFIMSAGLGLGVIVFLEFFTGRFLTIYQIPLEIRKMHRFELNLSRRGLKRVLRSGDGSPLAEELYDIDRMILALTDETAGVKNAGHILHLMPHDKQTPVKDVAHVIAKRLTDLQYEVAILDLDARYMIKGTFFTHLWQSVRVRLWRSPRRDVQITQDPVTRAYLHHFSPHTPADVIWINQNRLPPLLEDMQWTYDYLLILSPFLGAHKGNVMFTETADVNVVVSALGGSRIKPFKNLVQWIVAHDPVKPLFSLVTGKA